jgi:hypothetical protein
MSTALPEKKYDIPKYTAMVVGAGPAGLTVIGNLLEQGHDNIIWVDNSFEGGRVNAAYRVVPSNTKVKLFIDFAEALSPFRKIIDENPQIDGKDVIASLRAMEQDKGCELGNAADMVRVLTSGLKEHKSVRQYMGTVKKATLDQVNITRPSLRL